MLVGVYMSDFILTNIDADMAAASSFNIFSIVSNSIIALMRKGRLENLPGSCFSFSELMRDNEETLMQN